MDRSYSRFFRRCVFVRGLWLVVASAIALANSTAFAKVVPMQLCVDPSNPNCSATIQGAVNKVPAGGSAVITIAAGTFAEFNIGSFQSLLSLSFVGKGPGMTVVDGTNGFQVPTFNLVDLFNGELHNLTIENGSGGLATGGGSNVSFAFVTMTNKPIGTLKIENCEITGGVRQSNLALSGAVNFFGKMLIIDSTSITNNEDQGLVMELGHAFITNTTISRNSTGGSTASAEGCGIQVQAFSNPTPPSVVLDNVTITDNACVAGSGKVSEGGGIWVDPISKLSLANTVIANNTVSGGSMPPAGPDCFSSGKGLKSMGYNLTKDHSACAFTPAKTDLAEGTDPGLGSLAVCPSSGLKVQTPMGGSPLIGKGNPATPTGKVGGSSSSCLPTDECGTARAKGGCAIGAKQ